MGKNLFKVKNALLTSLLVAAIAGCGGGGGGGTASNAGNTNNQSNTGGNNGGNTTGQLKVTVYAEVNTPLPGATVVLGDSDGNLITHATTGADGKATFLNPPANATVTAAYRCASGLSSDRHLDVEYDINAPEIAMRLWDCNDNAATLGTVNVNVTSSINGIARWEVRSKNHSSSALSSAFTLTSRGLQSNGKFSVVAVGYAADGTPVAYGTALDQTFTNGMTVNINASKTIFTDVQYSFANIHASAKEYYVNFSEDSVDIYGVYRSGGTPIPTNITMKVIPGFDINYYSAGLRLDRDNDGISESNYYFRRYSSTLGAQTFDFNEMPTVPSNLSIGGSTERPVFSWTGSYASGDIVEISTYGRSSYYLTMPSTRTSATFPELPQTLADFRPNGISNFNITNTSYDTINGYEDLLLKSRAYYNGTWIYTGTIKEARTDK